MCQGVHGNHRSKKRVPSEKGAVVDGISRAPRSGEEKLSGIRGKRGNDF